jgi:hypothetical protein
LAVKISIQIKESEMPCSFEPLLKKIENILCMLKFSLFFILDWYCSDLLEVFLKKADFN